MTRRWPKDVPASLVDIMERVCTEAELDALEWKARGYGARKTAERLGVSRTSVQDRLKRASWKIRAEVAAMQGIGNGES